MTIEIIPVCIEDEIKQDDDLVELMLASKSKPQLQDGDIVVFTQKIISKQEGKTIALPNIHPDLLATGIASEYQKDPRVVQLILDQSRRIVRMRNGIIISETLHGFICANAGVDESNVRNGYVTLLPNNSDKSAEMICRQIKEKTGKTTAVIISDTFGRPFRQGQVNIAIGVAGIDAIVDYAGMKDAFGRILRVTAIAIADELCSATELVMGKSLHAPISIVRNYNFVNVSSTINKIIRSRYDDLFR
ncbi:MAG TPA: coenzyme F420-0:L-glutamate ligase [Candidatus Nitrosotalea sp.]|nr:coenzyme F420-0:L-glutamate ligase [Candidatus Nitrosotalea sp.]